MAWLLYTLVVVLGVTAIKQSTPSAVVVVPPRPLEEQPVIPDGYRRMRDKEVTHELAELAKTFLKFPYGAVEPVENTAGLDVLAALEQHYHPPGGEAKPYGWHKGVSLFIRDEP